MQDSVQDILNTDILKVTPDVSLEFAVSLALYRKLGDLYVIDHHQKLLGIVPEYTLIKALVTDQNEGQKVETLMSRHLLSCALTASICEVVPFFREARNESIAVLDRGKLVGQIRRYDILHWLAHRQYSENKTNSTLRPPHYLATQRANEKQKENC